MIPLQVKDQGEPLYILAGKPLIEAYCPSFSRMKEVMYIKPLLIQRFVPAPLHSIPSPLKKKQLSPDAACHFLARHAPAMRQSS